MQHIHLVAEQIPLQPLHAQAVLQRKALVNQAAEFALRLRNRLVGLLAIALDAAQHIACGQKARIVHIDD